MDRIFLGKFNFRAEPYSIESFMINDKLAAEFTNSSQKIEPIKRSIEKTLRDVSLEISKIEDIKQEAIIKQKALIKKISDVILKPLYEKNRNDLCRILTLIIKSNDVAFPQIKAFAAIALLNMAMREDLTFENIRELKRGMNSADFESLKIPAESINIIYGRIEHLRRAIATERLKKLNYLQQDDTA